MLSCQTRDHVTTLFKTACSESASDSSTTEEYNLRSSAKSLHFDGPLMMSTISLMNRMNRRGPKFEPWTTPLTTSSGVKTWPSIDTDWVRPSKKHLIQPNSSCEIPYEDNLIKSFECTNESSANNLQIAGFSTQSTTSLTKIMKRRGPIWLPCTTPLETGLCVDLLLSTTTHWTRFSRKFLIQLHSSYLNP